MAMIEIKVPDIGDFDEVAVIELMVKVGDTIKAEQSLITVDPAVRSYYKSVDVSVDAL